MRRMGRTIASVAFLGPCFLLLATRSAWPQGSLGAFTSFDVPVAGTGMLQGTIPFSINASGVVTGFYADSNGWHGFVRAAQGTIMEFDAPNAGTGISQGTFPVSINAAGDVTGWYIDSNNASHGFVRAANGTITAFDVSGASTGQYHMGTTPFSIDTAGDVTGTYTDSNFVWHGFLRTADGTTTSFDAPGAGKATQATGINSAGVITGNYNDASYVRHGFVRAADGTMTAPIDVPGAGTSGGGTNLTSLVGTLPLSINTAGDMTGIYTDANGQLHAFLRTAGGTVTAPIDASDVSTTGLLPGIMPMSINSADVIAGGYQDAGGLFHGFLRTATGTLTSFEAPAAGTAGSSAFPGTFATSVNNSGQITGAYADATGVIHGFVLTPSTLPTAATPAFSVPSGTYSSAQTVAISDTTPGATIYYSVNAPIATSSAVYTGPIQVSAAETIQAVATASGYATSAIATATYTISSSSLTPAATPTFSVSPGTYTLPISVSIYDATAGATICFTTDGTTPSTSSPQYTGPITVNSSETIEAIAVAQGYSTSSVAVAAYMIERTAVGQWTWMGGASTEEQVGSYGNLGTPAPGNVPGSRDSATSWTDSSGSFWLFGGSGLDAARDNGMLNDLWQFNITSRQWTWIAGSDWIPSESSGQWGVYGTLGTPAAGNTPGGRMNANSWTDKGGNLWLFGGVGVDSTGAVNPLNDLWEFNPTTRLWTWMGGGNTGGQLGVYGTLGTPAVGNVPGARSAASSWTDSSGNLWLFGGYGPDSTGADELLNDLWVFNPSTSLWTWMGGSTTGGQLGVYGTLGTPAEGNAPGARSDASSWTDSSGNLWLFGGNGNDSTSTWNILNDLWVFNPSTGLWTWTSGSNTGTPAGVYGTLGTPAAGNVPGGRMDANSWTDSSGNLWLFGGDGLDSTDTWGPLNDLWMFNPSTFLWTWKDGSSTNSQAGVYGALGVPAAGNTPGARASADSWTDSSGNLWLFGGDDNSGDLNDLWEYQVSASATPQAATPTFSVASGTYSPPQTVAIFDATPGATIYYTTNGTTPTTSSTQYTVPLTVSSTETVEAIATASGYTTSAVATATYTISALLPVAGVSPGSLTFSNQGVGTTSTSQPVTLSNTGTAALTISNIGTSANFGETNNCAGSVAASGSCTINVTFTPTATGTLTGTLTITDNSNGVTSSTQTVNLTGTGVATAPVAGISPGSLTFSNQGVGTTSTSQPVTLSNTGNAALTISNIGISANFGESNNCAGSVAASGSCTINVTFTPTATGMLTGTLTITDNSNGVTGSTQTVSLTGTGVATAPVAGVSTGSLTFGNQNLGTTSGSQPVTLSNTGNAALTITNIGTSANFAATNNCGGSVAASGSCTINVTFTPTATGTLTGTLTITDNSNGVAGSTQSVALSGTGQDFTLAAASGSSTSATVAPGQSATYTLTMAGEGGFNQSVSFTCAGAPSEATCTVPNPVTAGSSATNVTVTVTTTAPSVSAPRSRPLPPAPPLSPGLRGLLMLALVLALMAWAIGRRNLPGVSRWRSTMVPLASGLLLALALAAGCGGGGSNHLTTSPNPGTPAGTYTLTVTGTAGSGSSALSHSVTLTLTVS